MPVHSTYKVQKRVSRPLTYNIPIVSIFLRMKPFLESFGKEEESTPCGTDTSNATNGSVSPIIEKHEAAMLQLLGFGGFSLLLAILYNSIRRYIFRDTDNLNTTFDAGGKVSTSLTAVTVTSQLLWPVDLLLGPTVAAQNGIAGTFFYACGTVLNFMMFPILSLKFKLRAPGAKTFLQLLHARFGKRAHLLFTIFALMTNLVAIVLLIVAGISIFQSVIKDASPEFCVFLIATLIGSYSFVGGLGTTFYVSYFNAGLIFAILFVLNINMFFIEQEGELKILGNIDAIHKHLSCLRAPNGNEEQSYLSFISEGSMMWSVQFLIASVSITFCDQATWQSRIAAKPVQGVLGFFFASYIWFATTSVGATTGLAYLALSANNASFRLSTESINAGLIMPFIAEKVFGYAGAMMVVTMVTMALMSTGSGEVMAVSSILVYDIYQIHINPFRKGHTPSTCMLCGKEKIPPHDDSHANFCTENFCVCPAADECQEIVLDKFNRNCHDHNRLFSCRHHGLYRCYQNSLIHFKSWCILWVTLGLIPFGLAVNASGMDITWIFNVGATITIPGFPAALLCIVWVKTSTKGVIFGALSGFIAALTTNLAMASTLEGGLSNFLANTGNLYTAIAGNTCGLLVSLVVTITVSLFTHNIKDEADEFTEWQKLRDIDNPLSPWAELFREDFPTLGGARPTAEQLNTMFSKAKWFAYIGGGASLLLFVAILPSIVVSMHVVTSSQFRTYLLTLLGCCLGMAGVVIVATPTEEILMIIKQTRKRKGLLNRKPLLKNNGREIAKISIPNMNLT